MSHQPRLPLDWDAIKRADERERRREYFAEYYRRNREKKIEAAKARQKAHPNKTDRREYWRKRYRRQCAQRRINERD